MSIIKKNEFRRMTEPQLKEKLTELRKELMKIHTQKSSGAALENPGKPKAIKKTIARIIMLLNEKSKQTKEEMKKI